jgi:hypothetical protein
MDQATLLDSQIHDGQHLIDRPIKEGIALNAAFWAKESESGQWFLYLATPLVGEDGAKKPAYRRVNSVIREMQKDGFNFDPFEIKVIEPRSSISRDVEAFRDARFSKAAAWFPGSRLGNLPVEGAPVYPAGNHHKQTDALAK